MGVFCYFLEIFFYLFLINFLVIWLRYFLFFLVEILVFLRRFLNFFLMGMVRFWVLIGLKLLSKLLVLFCWDKLMVMSWWLSDLVSCWIIVVLLMLVLLMSKRGLWCLIVMVICLSSFLVWMVVVKGFFDLVILLDFCDLIKEVWLIVSCDLEFIILGM